MTAYLALESQLTGDGKHDEPILDRMDRAWLEMTDEEHEKLNNR